MFIAISTENTIVIIIIAVAGLMLIRQIYRFATGKATGCSCCSDNCSTNSKKDEHCPIDGEEQKPSEDNNEKPG